MHYHYNAVRVPLPLRFPPLPEEHHCTYWIVHKGLKGYPTKTLSLRDESTTPTMCASHVKINAFNPKNGRAMAINNVILPKKIPQFGLHKDTFHQFRGSHFKASLVASDYIRDDSE